MKRRAITRDPAPGFFVGYIRRECPCCGVFFVPVSKSLDGVTDRRFPKRSIPFKTIPSAAVPALPAAGKCRAAVRISGDLFAVVENGKRVIRRLNQAKSDAYIRRISDDRIDVESWKSSAETLLSPREYFGLIREILETKPIAVDSETRKNFERDERNRLTEKSAKILSRKNEIIDDAPWMKDLLKPKRGE